MKLPKTVHICGVPWKVRESRRLRAKLGLVNAERKEIVIRQDQSDLEKKRTLIHEMIHGFMWMLDEDCVEQLAVDIVDALEDCDE